MKKKLLFFPIIGLLLSGCSFEDIMFWKTDKNEQQQNDGDNKNGENTNNQNQSNNNNTTQTTTTDPGTNDTSTTTPVTTPVEIKTIEEVKQYIADHGSEIPVNSYGNGVDTSVEFTVQAYAIAKIDLKKTTKNYGLDVSYPGKVILADQTGWIAAASPTAKGANLWTKVADYQCKETSKYEVTGYISMYLGHPELMVTSYEWKSSLDISWSDSIYSRTPIELDDFYSGAENVNYNCAGHGYGDIVTVNNLKCYYMEPDGSGTRYYNFTDGINNIRVNAFNLGSVSIGSYYNVTGIISLENLSPIIVAFIIDPVQDPTPFTFNYESSAENISIENLKKIKGSKDDTSTRYPQVVESYEKVFKTTGYLCVVEQDSKLYIGISDTYFNNNLSGKDDSAAQNNLALIGNDNFWNTTVNDLANYNPFYDDYIQKDEQITVYYVLRHLSYQKKSGQTEKAIWKVLLVPDFISSYTA